MVLDTLLTDGLIEEGFVREVISKVQTMRKEAGFEVMDHIVLSASGSEKVLGIIGKNSDLIGKNVLADQFVSGTAEGYVKEWSLNGEKVTFGVKKVNG